MWMHSLGPRQCYGVRGDIFCCCCKFYISIQDVLFCLPNDFTCYSEVSQGTSDCDVSCTGLYSDVVFTEDKILNLETDLGGSKYVYFSEFFSQWMGMASGSAIEVQVLTRAGRACLSCWRTTQITKRVLSSKLISIRECLI